MCANILRSFNIINDQSDGSIPCLTVATSKCGMPSSVNARNSPTDGLFDHTFDEFSVRTDEKIID